MTPFHSSRRKMSPISYSTGVRFTKHLKPKIFLSAIQIVWHVNCMLLLYERRGWSVRWCWVNFQCRGDLLIWIRVRQGPTALAMGAGGGFLDIFTLVYHFSFLSPWETAQYRLKYCLKGLLSPKQPTKIYERMYRQSIVRV